MPGSPVRCVLSFSRVRLRASFYIFDLHWYGGISVLVISSLLILSLTFFPPWFISTYIYVIDTFEQRCKI